MAQFEKKCIYSSVNPFNLYISLNKIVIDYIFLLFNDLKVVKEFLQWISTYSRDSVTFLDIHVYRESSDVLAVRGHTKPTNKNSSLEYTSFHPTHLKQNLPFGQFLKLKHNAIYPRDYTATAVILSRQLADRGVPHYCNKISWVQNIPARQNIPASLLHDKVKEGSSSIQCALNFIELAHPIKCIIK